MRRVAHLKAIQMPRYNHLHLSLRCSQINIETAGMPDARRHLFPVPLAILIPSAEKHNDATGRLLSGERAQQPAGVFKIETEYDALEAKPFELHAVRPFPETSRTSNSPPPSRTHRLVNTKR